MINFFSKFKKRTYIEVQEATRNGDYTGGYNFFPWLIHMRKFMVFAFFLNIFFGYKALEGYFDNGLEIVTLLVSLFFGVAVPSLIAVLLLREYKEKKQGISS